VTGRGPAWDGGAGSSRLSAARRQRELAGLPGEVVDLLVVGLGITGAGVALDAAARGLSVAAVDAHDLAFGTSRWSSKLVHGGLRYLPAGDVGLAYESAAERGLLMDRLAPHLIRPLPFLLPYPAAAGMRTARLWRTGHLAGDALRGAARTGRHRLPRSRPVGVVEAQALAPAVRRRGLRGGVLSYDGQLVDDARLVVAVARTAAGLGARIITRCRAVALSGDGATVRDELTGSTVDIRARAVVNATGVWAGCLVDGVELRPSRGTHLVLRAEALGPLPTALTLPLAGELNRFALILPQDDGRVYVGLTDEPVDGPIPDVPSAEPSDVDTLLSGLAETLEVPLDRSQVAGTFAGLRPLLAGAAGRTADLSRRHAVLVSADGVVTVVGGKLTTYRRMAADAVEAACRRAALPAGPDRSHRVPLVGAASPAELAAVPAPRRLVHRYGTDAPAVLALAGGNPELLRPVAPGLPVTGAELLWAVVAEGALDEDDLLDRRTRIGLLADDREAALPAARAALARHPGSVRTHVPPAAP